jgi:hypothetical protein
MVLLWRQFQLSLPSCLVCSYSGPAWTSTITSHSRCFHTIHPCMSWKISQIMPLTSIGHLAICSILFSGRSCTLTPSHLPSSSRNASSSTTTYYPEAGERQEVCPVYFQPVHQSGAIQVAQHMLHRKSEYLLARVETDPIDLRIELCHVSGLLPIGESMSVIEVRD